MLEKILDHLNRQQDTVVALQRRLVSIPALGPDNGGDGEKNKYDFVKEYLVNLGVVDLREMHAPDSRVTCRYRPNLAAVVPGADRDKTLWIISHLDIVPPGDPNLWLSDPYELKVVDDGLYGRGVEDNHMALVVSLLLAKAFIESDVQPAFNIGLLIVSDEETGSKYGLDYIMREHQAHFRQTDLFLVPDFGVPDSSMVEIAEKSMLWQKITVLGRQCHASAPSQGRNSLLAAAAFILKLQELKRTFDREDILFEPPCSTFEPTKKEANVENINTIPGKDVFYLDCRVLPDYDLDEVIATIVRYGREIEAEYGVDIQYDTVQKEPAAPPTPLDSEIVVRLVRAIKAEYGSNPKPMGVGGGTVAAYLRRRGYEAAVWATWIPNAHQPNERSSIRNTVGDAKVVARMLLPRTDGR